jgi:hypothetical protein
MRNVTTKRKFRTHNQNDLQFILMKRPKNIVTWMAKSLVGNDSVYTLKRTQQQKYECLLLVAGQQAAHH